LIYSTGNLQLLLSGDYRINKVNLPATLSCGMEMHNYCNQLIATFTTG